LKVKLISYSQSPNASLGDIESPLDLVAYCARVSNPSNQNNTATNEKLVKYLMKHKHWSPLEKLPEISHDKFSVIDHSRSKSSVNDMQIQLKT
jgi:thymidylate synthase ThyX